MEQQLSLDASPVFAAAHTLRPNDIAEQLAFLRGQHALLTEQLRELCDETAVPSVTGGKWRELENNVLNLRFEMETFKQVFPSAEVFPVNNLISADLLEF